MVDGYHFSDLEDRYVNVSGDTMTGALIGTRIWLNHGSNLSSNYSWTNSALTVPNIEVQNYTGTVETQYPTITLHHYGYGGPRLSSKQGIMYIYGGNTDAKTLGSKNTYFKELRIYPYNDNIYISDYKVWHAGNQGSGSGLDADLLDGYHYNQLPYLSNSAYVSRTINGGSADTWYRIARNKTTDMVRARTTFYLTVGGGSWSPNWAKFMVLGSWSRAYAYELRAETNNSVWDGIRTTYEGDYIYIEVHFVSACSSTRLYVPRNNWSLDNEGNHSWEWFEGTLSAGGGTQVSILYPTTSGINTNNGLMVGDKLVFPHGGSSYAWDRINEGYNRTSIRAYCTAGESASGARDNYSIGLMIDGYYSFALAGYGGGATLAWRNNSGTWYDIITSQNIGSQSVNYANSAGKLQTSRKIWGQSFNGTADVDGTLYLHRSSSGSYGRISFYDESFYTWFTYMTPVGSSSPTGTNDPSGTYVTSWAIRSLIENNSGYGWVWESCSNSSGATPDIKMEVSSNTGNFWVKGSATSTGFKKKDSSDSYFLLGGGGHTATSNYSLSTHNHDGRYLQYNGWWTSGNGNNADNANGMVFAHSNHNVPTGWGILTTFDYQYNSSYKMQLFSYGYSNGYTYYRNRSADRNGWNAWVRFLDSTNYTEYTVTKTGGGASGTWDINITGSAGNSSAADKLNFERVSDMHTTTGWRFFTLNNSSPSNGPGTSGWAQGVTFLPNNDTGGYRHIITFWGSGTDNELWIKNQWAGSWGSWRKLLTSANSSVSKSGETLTVKINGTSYSLTNSTYNFYGTTFYSGYSSGSEHNCNNATANGHYYYNSNGPSGIGNTTSDGALYVQSYSSDWVGQIAQDYRNGRLFVRGKNNGSWTSWLRVALYSEIPSSVSVDYTIWRDNSNSTDYKIQVVSSLPSSPNSNTFYVIV